MAQLFHPGANYIYRTIIVVTLVLSIASLAAIALFPRTSYETGLNEYVDQDIPFSHEHHAGEIGIDCRFCHNFVEKSSYAGMPQTRICMKCHSVLFENAPMLEPVRQSYITGKPLVWNRVSHLPDFVYFDHSIHVSKGVSCQTCHGPVESMPLMRKHTNYFMSWCLNCHRNAQDYLGDKADQERIRGLTDCGTCHQ